MLLEFDRYLVFVERPPYGPSWSWSYDSWIYNYSCNQCLSPLTLWVRILLSWCVLDTKITHTLVLHPPLSQSSKNKPRTGKHFLLLKGDMVFNANFSNIWIISWQSVLLVEETRGPGENHWPVEGHWQTLSHNVVLNAIASSFGFRSHNSHTDHDIPFCAIFILSSNLLILIKFLN